MSAQTLSFLAGARKVFPILLGIIPFGMIYGVAAIERDLSPLIAQGMSVLVFAGAAQLAAVDLMGQNASAVVIVLTALVINLRFTMYSASMAPHFLRLSPRIKLPLGYLLTDQAFLISISEFDRDPAEGQKVNKLWFYLGAAIPLWCGWQLSTATGIFLGARIPASWSLDFAIPLTFIALLVPVIRSRGTATAAAVSGIAAVFAMALPLHLGMIVAAFLGIGAGVLVERKKQDE